MKFTIKFRWKILNIKLPIIPTFEIIRYYKICINYSDDIVGLTTEPQNCDVYNCHFIRISKKEWDEISKKCDKDEFNESN